MHLSPSKTHFSIICTSHPRCSLSILQQSVPPREPHPFLLSNRKTTDGRMEIEPLTALLSQAEQVQCKGLRVPKHLPSMHWNRYAYLRLFTPNLPRHVAKSFSSFQLGPLCSLTPSVYSALTSTVNNSHRVRRGQGPSPAVSFLDRTKFSFNYFPIWQILLLSLQRIYCRRMMSFPSKRPGVSGFPSGRAILSQQLLRDRGNDSCLFRIRIQGKVG